MPCTGLFMTHGFWEQNWSSMLGHFIHIIVVFSGKGSDWLVSHRCILKLAYSVLGSYKAFLYMLSVGYSLCSFLPHCPAPSCLYLVSYSQCCLPIFLPFHLGSTIPPLVFNLGHKMVGFQTDFHKSFLWIIPTSNPIFPHSSLPPPQVFHLPCRFCPLSTNFSTSMWAPDKEGPF